MLWSHLVVPHRRHCCARRLEHGAGRAELAVLQGRLAAGQEDVDPDHLIYLLSLSYVPAGGGEPQTLH